MHIYGRKKKVIATAVAIEELVTRDSLDITSADIDLENTNALLKVKSTATGTAKIKVDLAGAGTTMTLIADDVNEANIHVKKVYSTSNGTDAAMDGEFFLWQ